MKREMLFEEFIYSINSNKEITCKDVSKVIKRYLIFKNLNDYVKEIVFNCEAKQACNLQDYKLFIDYHEKIFPDDDITIEMEIANKLDLACTIAHELTHVEQCFLLDNNIMPFNSSLIDEEFNSALDLCSEDFEKYSDYHDYFIHEYYAILNSHKIVDEYILSKLNESKMHLSIIDYNRLIASEILSAYLDFDLEKISFPLLNNHLLLNGYIKSSFESEINTLLKRNLSTYEKIKMGLPIDTNTITLLNDIADGKHKTLSLFKDIKKLL